MRWKIVGAALLIVAGLGATAFAVIRPSFGSTASVQYLTSRAAVTNVLDQVAATGTVEAAATYSLTFGSAPTEVTSSSSTNGSASAASSGGSTASWVVATVTAEAGQSVKKGDVLATSDASSAQLSLAVAQANLASAQARLTSDQTGLTSSEKAAAKLQVTQAQQSLTQAKQSYSSTVAQNSLKLDQGKAAVADAKAKLASDQAAGAPDSVIEADQKAVSDAEASLSSLTLQVSQSNTQAKNQITQATYGLESAQLAYSQKTAPADAATIAVDKATVAQAEASVTAATTALQYTSLVSPVDGVVVAVNVTPGLAAPSGSAITIRSTAFKVTASVTESDLPSIKVGQDATVTITALAKDVTGKVTSISQSASSSSGSVVSYGIVIDLPTAADGTVPGMSAEIAITTASALDVLAVPAIALQSAGDGTYAVRVLDGSGNPTSVTVEVGLITSSYAEIKSGIAAGTAVVTGTASSSTTNGSTSSGGGLRGLEGGGFGPGTFTGPRQ
jgi:multidrug efflux pump subunit AcrA (membrane-fusion protein)